mmetsp:Transcript_135975/g.290638  ORF Transcript_135975/g.290638 Transcript_135975/m.290638 type:complete len:240 (+) Transcript_135975:1999-2718(+)
MIRVLGITQPSGGQAVTWPIPVRGQISRNRLARHGGRSGRLTRHGGRCGRWGRRHPRCGQERQGRSSCARQRTAWMLRRERARRGAGCRHEFVQRADSAVQMIELFQKLAHLRRVWEKRRQQGVRREAQILFAIGAGRRRQQSRCCLKRRCYGYRRCHGHRRRRLDWGHNGPCHGCRQCKQRHRQPFSRESKARLRQPSSAREPSARPCHHLRPPAGAAAALRPRARRFCRGKWSIRRP